jgi:N-acetylglutamate synthase-like GNAT family acetyltransferase
MKTKTHRIVHTDADGLWTMVRNHRANADIFTRLKYMNAGESRKEDHFLVLQRTKIIAAASLQKSPYEPSVVWIKHISVDEKHQNKGHATQLVRAIFNHAAQSNITLQSSSFTEMGRKYLAGVMQRLHADYPDLKIRYP